MGEKVSKKKNSLRCGVRQRVLFRRRQCWGVQYVVVKKIAKKVVAQA